MLVRAGKYRTEDKFKIQTAYKLNTTQKKQATQIVIFYDTQLGNVRHKTESTNSVTRLDWIEQCFMSPPTQYRLYGKRFLQVKDPTNSIKVLKEKAAKENNTKKHKENKTHTHRHTHTHKSIQITVTQINTASPLVYNNMG